MNAEPVTPPQNLDAEEALLGAMLLAPAAIDTVRDLIQAGDFYRASHSSIFTVLLDLRDQEAGTDAVCAAAELERRGQLAEAGGKVRVHELAGLVPPAANAPHYARLVAGKARDRALLALLEPLVHALYDGTLVEADAGYSLEHAAHLLDGDGSA